MNLKTQMPSDPVRRTTGIDDAPPAYAQPVTTYALIPSSEGLAPSSSTSHHIHRSHSLPEDQAKQSIARFGNPYATNATWSPSDQDARLRKLPSLAFTMRLQQRFARKAGDIFNPPCPSMQRPLPTNIAKDDKFEPYQCMGKGDLASDGFKSVYNGVILTSRDVSTADWFRFIQDLTVASRLSGAQEALAGMTPITKRLLLPGYLVTKLIRYSVVRKREPLIFETVEEWNARFFSTRGIDVFIHNGVERLTATSVGDAIPSLEVKYWRNTSKAPQVTEDSNSSDSSDDEDLNEKEQNQRQGQDSGGSHKNLDRRQQRRERRLRRKAQRGQQSNADGNSGQKMMMLVVAHCKPASEAGPAVLDQAVLTSEPEIELPTYQEPSPNQSSRLKGEKS